MLLDYFEESVAAGTQFLPGQVVLVGWADFRIIERSDGTLGLEERDPWAESDWSESVDESLMQVWFQQEVCRSLGLDSSFPRQTQTAIVCTELFNDPGPYVLDRARADDSVSGWFVGCGRDEHDHNEESNLELTLLWLLVAKIPFLGQFLALPPKTFLEVAGPRPLRLTVALGGHERKPLRGSYLEAAQKRTG
jgi:hypothetical protein